MKLPLEIEVYRETADGLELATRHTLDAGTHDVGRSEACHVRLEGARDSVSRVHFKLEVSEDAVTVQDNGSRNATRIGDAAITRAEWTYPQVIRIPGFEIRQAAPAGREAGAPKPPPASADSAETKLVQPTAGLKPIDQIDLSRIIGKADALTPREAAKGFPADILGTPTVSVASLKASGLLLGEWEYVALGGGIGSFVWVDHLRIYGVPEAAIRVIGINPVCYANYERYCKNSQIPAHERLRSNSISAPDNIWGFPGYASRETVKDLARFRLGGLKHIFQVFGEPALAISYTPQAGDVFRSLDKEADRIGWKRMFIKGRVLRIRMTDDGRYAIAWRTDAGDEGRGRRDNIVIASHVHIATGYPATNFTRELQTFRTTHTADKDRVINAYEEHEALYADIEASSRPVNVMVNGRGIVASRILQRLTAARARNPQIKIVHQMRTRLADGVGSRWGRAKRWAYNDVEHQPFNWPKSCWGGTLRGEIERATPERRTEIFSKLGGTTTAVRGDWLAIPKVGTKEGWYRKAFGTISKLTPNGSGANRRIEVVLKTGEGQTETLQANYIIDCTGLIANVGESPFLDDMIKTYGLDRNRISGNGGEQRVTGISVSNDFDIPGMRTQSGRVYAAGTITQNGPYAAFDSFLGLQYAALRSVDNLGAIGGRDVGRLGAFSSFRQWLRWCRGAKP
jgi:pSer/pThr/pTyr-binding forkhead associated (FHA) protein